MMRSSHTQKQEDAPAATAKESKIQNASSKICSVLSKVFIPLLDSPVGQSVSFHIEDNETINRKYVEHLGEINPGTVKDKDSFISKMAEIYDDLQMNKELGT
jgi:hypothetical protein